MRAEEVYVDPSALARLYPCFDERQQQLAAAAGLKAARL
jgi:hypothetical protein